MLDTEKLTELMREASGNKDLAVEVKPLVNDSVPVMLIACIPQGSGTCRPSS